jgi:amidase
MDETDIAFAGIARQAELVRDGTVTPRELVELSLDRIRRIDPLLNSVRVTFPEQALAEADAARPRVRRTSARATGRPRRRARPPARPLLGVPVLIKDDVDVAGAATTFGSGAYGRPPQQDAEVVRRLRAAGAIVVGKTHTPELMQWPFTESATWGVTRNPWDRDRTPGGSSGGSAAAVAAGLAGVALATDGAGSIRIPASCCGLYGLKPTRGLVPGDPRPDQWHGLSVIGCVTRGVQDTALYLDVVAERRDGAGQSFVQAAASDPGRLRIACSTRNPLFAPLREEPRRAYEQTIELLRSLGHTVEEVDPPYGDVLVQVIGRYLRGIHDDARALAHPERLERRTKGMTRMAKAFPPPVVAALRRREAATHARLQRAIFADHDVLLTPALAAQPLPIGRYEGRGALWTFNGVARFTPYTPPWNATGQPAASVPAGFTDAGVPLAVQLVGRRFDEPRLLALSAQLEAARPWAAHRPSLAV